MKQIIPVRFFREHHESVALFCVGLMLFGFLWGRAFLSVGMFLFCVNVLCAPRPLEGKRPVFWLLGLAWVGLYFLSGLWSTDMPYWQERVQVKLPFLIFPVAFAYFKKPSEKALRVFTAVLAILAFCGSCFTLYHFVRNSDRFIEGYSYAKVLPTPAYRDHIRFSIFIAWTALWMFWRAATTKRSRDRWLCGLASAYFICFLHLLAVKSGLIVLYAFCAVGVVYLFLMRKWVAAFAICITAVGLFWFALHKVPSFKSKFYYVLFSIQEYKNGNRTADISDIGRLVSYDLALKIFRENPVAGVGAGDVRLEMKSKYLQFSPETKPEQRIVPHNQLLETAIAGGVITLIPFLIWLFYPLRFLRKTKNAFLPAATWVGLFFAMQFEAMLEVQFGVFVFLFCLLWSFKAAEEPQTALR